MSKNWHSILLIIVGTCMAGTVWGQLQSSNIQPRLNSPLSRFGIGDPVEQYLASTAGMAGLSAGWQDAYHLNMQNPASMASLLSTAFEGGFYVKNGELKEGEATDKIWSGNLQYLSLAFPLRNPINRALDRQSDDWSAGMGLKLAPYSQVGYDIRLVDTQTPGVEQATNTLKGTGGTYRLQWGTGFRYKQLSVGVNAGFLFGNIINSRLVAFDSLQNSLNTEFQDETSIKGTTWDLGLQYTIQFKKPNKEGELVPSDKRLVIGAYGGTGTNIKTETTQFARRYLGNVVSDTLLFNESITGSGKLPSEWTLGFAYHETNKLQVGAEVGIGNWSNYENTTAPDETFENTWRVAAGVEWTPDFSSYNNYYKRIRYRAGIKAGTDPRTLNGEQINYTALTFGFGFPIVLPRQQVSFFNTALELGRTGVTDVLQETYVKLTLGFTLNDNSWFFKRKFN